MEQKMTETKITQEVRLRLDEVDFVYKELPRALERARKATAVERWGNFFRDQAHALREQHQALRLVAGSWGKRRQPRFSPEVEQQLNEARHALRTRNSKPDMEDKIGEVCSYLRERVLTLLDEAIQLATRIREDDLVQRLRSIRQVEHAQQARKPRSMGG